ncbi:MAG: calcium/sodium antiporter [Myxococcota bacterium]
MDLFLNSALVVVSIFLLWKGADFFVDSAVRVAKRFNISDLVIGLTLVAFGTSAPEFAVSIGAALTGRASMSIGNVIGSNVFNLGIILGSCAAIRAIPTTEKLVNRDGVFLVFSVALLAFMMNDGDLSQLNGAIALAMLGGYLIFMFINKEAPDDVPGIDDPATWKDVPLAGLGLAMILGGAHFLVNGASDIARTFGLSEWAISVTVVAAGTSAPELVTSLNAALKGRFGISAGNLIGSDLFNMLGVLGITAVITPLPVEATTRTSMWITLGSVALVVLLLRTGWRLTRWEGVALVAANLVRWGVDVFSTRST